MTCSNCDCPFFELQAEGSPFSEEEIQCMLADAVQYVEFAKGEILFLQGQSSNSLYSLTSGMVKICTHSTDGREQIVGLSSPGNLLVGLQSINDDRYAYSATAATPVTACKIRHRRLMDYARDRGDIAVRLMGAVNAQLAHTRALMEVLGQKCAAAKVASFILLLTGTAHNGGRRFRLPFSRLEIASILGLSEETVCRLMAEMKRDRVIYAPRGKIEIRNLEQLRAIAGDGVGQLGA